MTRHSASIHIALVITAVAAGILLDRFVLSRGSAPRTNEGGDRPARTAAAQSAATSEGPDRPGMPSRITGSETAPREQGANPTTSLDAILARKDQRQRLRE